MKGKKGSLAEIPWKGNGQKLDANGFVFDISIQFNFFAFYFAAEHRGYRSIKAKCIGAYFGVF